VAKLVRPSLEFLLSLVRTQMSDLGNSSQICVEDELFTWLVILPFSFNFVFIFDFCALKAYLTFHNLSFFWVFVIKECNCEFQLLAVEGRKRG
jgi:hypothetical protein